MSTSVRKNLYWNTLLRIPVRIICFFVSIYVARLLDPADFGIMAITMMGIGYANLLTNFGLNEAIIQQKITCKETINSIFTVDIIISLCLAALFILGAGLIADFFNENRSKDVIKVMSIVFVITSFSGIPTVLLRRDNKFKMLAWFEMSKSLVTSLLTMLLAFLHFGYWSLVYGQVIPLLIFTVIICVQTKWLPIVSFQFKLLKPVLHFGLWSFLKTQTIFLGSHFEKILVGKVLGTHSLGIYDKAKSIAVVPSESLLMNINSVMFSAFSHNKNELEVLRDHFAKSIFLTSLISFPIYLGFIAIAPYFVPLFLGEKWVEMIIPLQIIMAGYLFKSFGGLLTSFNVGVGKYKNQTLMTMFSGVILIILCLCSIRHGITGVATAFLIFCIIEFCAYILISLKHLKLHFWIYFKFIFTALWSSAIMFMGTTYISLNYCSEINLWNMTILVVAGGGLYLSCVIVDKTSHSTDFKNKILKDIDRLLKKTPFC